MGANFVGAAAKPVRNVKQFLRDAADNSIKYVPERNTKHQLYIPYRDAIGDDGAAVKELVAMARGVHDMVPSAGKFEATICLKGLNMTDPNVLDEDGQPTLVNDGSCPFCDHVSAGWEIRNYLRDMEEKKAVAAGKTGTELTDYMKQVGSNLQKERKVKEARMYIYLLVAKFKLNADGKTPILGADGLPEFELKVAKWSSSRVEKIQETFDNSGIEFEGGEIVFKYPDVDSAMQLASQNTASPLYGNAKFVDKYAGLKEKIDAEVSKWVWDDLPRSFKEWEGYTVKKAESICKGLFKEWEKYKADIGTPNEHAYLETSCTGPNVTNPALATSTPVSIGVQTPVVGGEAIAGGIAMPDPNAVFTSLDATPKI